MTDIDSQPEHRLRVIVADDDPVARALIEAVIEKDEALELLGSAEDAPGAVALAAEHQPDVAVLDWIMPGGGGPKAAREIVQASPVTRIIGLTASDMQEASVDMMRSGARSFVLKGGPPGELVQTIRQVGRARLVGRRPAPQA